VMTPSIEGPGHSWALQHRVRPELNIRVQELAGSTIGYAEFGLTPEQRAELMLHEPYEQHESLRTQHGH
jgi:hypothetical protein